MSYPSIPLMPPILVPKKIPLYNPLQRSFDYSSYANICLSNPLQFRSSGYKPLADLFSHWAAPVHVRAQARLCSLSLRVHLPTDWTYDKTLKLKHSRNWYLETNSIWALGPLDLCLGAYIPDPHVGKFNPKSLHNTLILRQE